MCVCARACACMRVLVVVRLCVRACILFTQCCHLSLCALVAFLLFPFLPLCAAVPPSRHVFFLFMRSCTEPSRHVALESANLLQNTMWHSFDRSLIMTCGPRSLSCPYSPGRSRRPERLSPFPGKSASLGTILNSGMPHLVYLNSGMPHLNSGMPHWMYWNSGMPQ